MAGIQAVVDPWMRADMDAASGWAAALQDLAIRAEAIQRQPDATRDEWLRHPVLQTLLPGQPPVVTPPP